MDKQMALQILQLDPNANFRDIEKKYRAESIDIRQRMSDAPSYLKPDFEEKLGQIDMAYQVLAIGFANSAWLPSAESVNAPNQQHIMNEHHPSTGLDKPFVPPPSTSVPDMGFIKKNGNWFFGLFVLCLALSTYFGIKASGLNKILNELQPKADKVDKTLRVLKNGKFKVKNEGNIPYRILGAKALYSRGDSVLVSFIKNFEPGKPYILEPGSRPFELTDYIGTDTVYNGDVLIWFLHLEDEEHPYSYTRSGICQDENGFVFTVTK
jgi:hypothetical protein